jgi:uncharacterized NAD(P)/FAD-binding protein YdhS
MTRHALIIGGGATGVAVFIGLVRSRAADRIEIIDPLPAARGIAFAAVEPDLLCNTSVATMSVVPGVPTDFLDYLRSLGRPVHGNDFVPRQEFARYLRDRFARCLVEAERAGIPCRQVRDRARAVRTGADGRYRVLLAEGRPRRGTEVFLCLGYGRPIVPESLRGLEGSPGLVLCPYPDRALLAAVPRRARVLVLGARLSALDAVLLLSRDPVKAREVVMASRSGTLPAVRTGTPLPSPGAPALDWVPALEGSGPSLARQVLARIDGILGPAAGPRRTLAGLGAVERLRAEVRLAEEGRTSWQDLLVALVDAANDALVRQDRGRRERALRTCHGLLARYLGAFPLHNAKRLLGLLDSGRVRFRAGTPVRLHPAAEAWRADWEDGSRESFHTVVCAAGFHLPRFQGGPDGLDLDSGSAAPGRPLEVDPDLRVILPGRSHPERIWTLGISSHGRVPLVNAVYQAVRQAEAVVRSLAAPGPPLLAAAGAGTRREAL